MTTSPIDPNRVLLTGENPYIRLGDTDGGPTSTDASFWRIISSPLADRVTSFSSRVN